MIQINLEKDKLFDELGLRRLRESYMRDDENSPQERFAYIAQQFGSNPEHAQRMYTYMSDHWISNSTPILSFGKTKGSLPISCYLTWLEDTRESIRKVYDEVSVLSMLGGGVGIGMGLRSIGGKSAGVIAHAKTYDASMMAFKQGETRRGSYALYLDVHHPEIIPFIEMRKPTGDPSLRCNNINYGVNLTDEFMQIIENCMYDENYDDTFYLRDPDGTIKRKESAKRIWQLILETRKLTGFPFLHFIDTSNKFLPEFLKKQGLSVRQTNLCTEIVLPTNAERTAVCCLISFNLVYYDQFKDNKQFFRDVLEFIDNVLQYFIDNAPDDISKARYSAMRERSIGLGALGFHAYLQKNNIAFESALAVSANKRIFKNLHEKCMEVNYELGKERGEAPDAIGTGLRFSHTFSIAPNASSSIILGNTSPSVEPFRANCYRQDTLSGFYFHKNPYLDEIIREDAKDHDEDWYDEVWSQILADEGSVRNIDFLTDWQKSVFATFPEIDQMWIIEHAAHRQPWIDQAQSINIMAKPYISIKELHDIHFAAWKKGLKTLYYCRSVKIGSFDKLSKQIERKKLDEPVVEHSDCIACE